MGRTINISKNGRCFITHYPLRSKHVLKSKKSMGRYVDDIVIWIRELGDQNIGGAELIDEPSQA